MTTIKIQIPVSPETIEREITLPAYRKSSTTFYKVMNEKDNIEVFQNGDSVLIANWSIGGRRVLSNRDFSDCTKEEFEKAFEVVLDKISNLQIQHA